MKLRVQRRDKQIEVLTFVCPVEAYEGKVTLSHLHSADGTDYYFTLDGYYDGWAREIPEGVTKTEALEMIKQMEKDRQIGGDAK